MSTRDEGGIPRVAQDAERASTRRLLAACGGLLTAFALLLIGASSVGTHLRPPLGRVPLATYAAREGITLPPDPNLADQGRARGSATGRRAGAATVTPRNDVGRVAPAQSAGPPLPAGAGPPLAEGVVAAYLRAWEVWAEACLTLDTAPLERAFAPPELDRVRAYVRQLRASGRALRLEATHRVTVLELRGDRALLLDEVTDRSVYLDLATRRPLPSTAQPTPTGQERLRCRLLRTADGWRVIEMVWER
jgi:hypothetical protein